MMLNPELRTILLGDYTEQRLAKAAPPPPLTQEQRCAQQIAAQRVFRQLQSDWTEQQLARNRRT